MKLIKLNPDHYVVVDDSEIKEGDWFIDVKKPLLPRQIKTNHLLEDLFDSEKKITHSTEPLEDRDNSVITIKPVKSAKAFYFINPLSLQEVKELIGEVDVQKKAESYAKDGLVLDTPYANGLFYGYIDGYSQALEDNKEKKYTEEDMINAFREGTNAGALHERLSDYDNGDYEDAEQYSEQYKESFIKSLQPKTQWEVEIVGGKLKLL